MRKAISFLLILTNILYIHNISKEKCDLIQCNENDKETTNKGVCLNVSVSSLTGAKTWLFNKCANGYYCPGATGYPDLEKSYSCEMLPDDSDFADMAKFCKNQLPGEPCNFNEHCLSGICNKHRCVGVEVGLKCTKNADCAIGLYCNSSVCTLLKGLGESCTDNYQCKNDAGCLNGKCEEYFTQAIGTEVKDAKLCNFNIARTTPDKRLICDGLQLIKSECGEGQDACSYRWYISGETYTTECMCDPTKRTQNRKCPSLLEASRPFVYTERHTELRFTPTCDSVNRQLKTNCTGITIYGEEAWKEISSNYIFANIFALIIILISLI
jgi:hypothetical protein